MAAAKTEDVKLTSIRYPGEDLGIWTILRGFFIIISFFGMLMALTGAFPFGLVFVYALILVLLLPYTNLKLKEKTGFGITRGLKIVILIGLLFVGGLMLQTKEGTYTTKNTAISEQPTVIGNPSSVDEQKVQQVTANPAVNKKTDYIKSYVKLEDVETGEGYGQFDTPGYSKKKPTVQGKIRNTGNQTLDTVQITVYFLDSTGTRIGETQYYPISEYSILGDKTPLKPNYVRNWGYVVADAPSGWDKRVEVLVSDITFTEE